jgi:hypothetical protein
LTAKKRFKTRRIGIESGAKFSASGKASLYGHHTNLILAESAIQPTLETNHDHHKQPNRQYDNRYG